MDIQIPTVKLPQNLKTLLKDIGENAVLFHIYTKVYQTKWQAFKNLAHSGCDIVLLNMKTNKTVKIEVKTRQTLYTTATSQATVNKRQFEVTKNEYKEMDILICYWFDYNSFFIVPKNELKLKNNTIRLRISRNKHGNYGKNEKYRDNWNNLMRFL